jgi:hypothetical protein
MFLYMWELEGKLLFALATICHFLKNIVHLLYHTIKLLKLCYIERKYHLYCFQVSLCDNVLDPKPTNVEHIDG